MRKRCSDAVLASLPIEIDVKVFQFAAPEMCITLRRRRWRSVTETPWCARACRAIRSWRRTWKQWNIDLKCRNQNDWQLLAAHPPCGNFLLDARELETRCFRETMCFRSCPMKSRRWIQWKLGLKPDPLDWRSTNTMPCWISRRRFDFRSFYYHESRTSYYPHTNIHPAIINMKLVTHWQ